MKLRDYEEGLDKTFKRVLENQIEIDSANPDVSKIRNTINNSNTVLKAVDTKISLTRELRASNAKQLNDIHNLNRKEVR